MNSFTSHQGDNNNVYTTFFNVLCHYSKINNCYVQSKIDEEKFSAVFDQGDEDSVLKNVNQTPSETKRDANERCRLPRPVPRVLPPTGQPLQEEVV